MRIHTPSHQDTVHPLKEASTLDSKPQITFEYFVDLIPTLIPIRFVGVVLVLASPRPPVVALVRLKNPALATAEHPHFQFLAKNVG